MGKVRAHADWGQGCMVSLPKLLELREENAGFR